MIKEVAVIGAGTMGNGIAHVFAQSGYHVSLVDMDQGALVKALDTIRNNLDRMIKKEKITDSDKQKTLANITTYSGNEKSSAIAKGAKNADLVIEAVTESKNVKFNIFKELDAVCKPNCILASNTSSISITKIGAQTQRPDKVIGMHFMNPVPMMQLIEVIKAYKTSSQVIKIVMDVAVSLAKKPVLVNDYPGFVANRILMPMIKEAIITLNEGIAGVEEIDTVMKLGMAHPMGPLQLADFIGLDVCLSIMQVLYEGIGDTKYAPPPILINMVNAGILGVKSGEGFYNWKHGTKELIVSEYFKKFKY